MFTYFTKGTHTYITHYPSSASPPHGYCKKWFSHPSDTLHLHSFAPCTLSYIIYIKVVVFLPLTPAPKFGDRCVCVFFSSGKTQETRRPFWLVSPHPSPCSSSWRSASCWVVTLKGDARQRNIKGAIDRDGIKYKIKIKTHTHSSFFSRFMTSFFLKICDLKVT